MATHCVNDIDIDSHIREPRWRAVSELNMLIKSALSAVMSEHCLRPFLEISLLFTDDGQMRTLNQTYRQQDKPTNVLSFSTQNRLDLRVLPVLGDIVLAFETIEREANERGISIADHTAHLIIHGYLHLQGLDHENAEEATQMEALEIKALQHLGITNPYDKENM